jgi:polyhydroxyalkanoate synthesis repressor PhaR
MTHGITLIKKYANRRLYDTGRSSYVTLDDVATMLREGHDFKVVDAKTNKDLTKSVLIQIIVEQESNDDIPNLLPITFLKELIKFYGGDMDAFLPTYLEQAIANFTQSQTAMREQMEQSFGSMMPTDSMLHVNQMGGLAKHNLDMMQKTMEMLTPFGSVFDKGDKK